MLVLTLLKVYQPLSFSLFIINKRTWSNENTPWMRKFIFNVGNEKRDYNVKKTREYINPYPFIHLSMHPSIHVSIRSLGYREDPEYMPGLTPRDDIDGGWETSFWAGNRNWDYEVQKRVHSSIHISIHLSILFMGMSWSRRLDARIDATWRYRRAE